MAIVTFELVHGYQMGESTHMEVGLRKLTTGDYIDAQLAAEKVVVQNGKALSYTSDVLMGLELLCRQVEYIGAIQGPFTIKDVRKLHEDDFQLIQEQAEALDNQLAEALAERGRSVGGA
ncbi:MAG: phage tail assembly protein [Marinomonas sp.]|uniref:phage tail assembly protein n=1 Tax=Marinomonas sp. TaxID=1904862 RepID=UPI003F9CA9E4